MSGRLRSYEGSDSHTKSIARVFALLPLRVAAQEPPRARLAHDQEMVDQAIQQVTVVRDHHQRPLAGPVRADDSPPLSVHQIEIELPEELPPSVCHAEIARFEHPLPAAPVWSEPGLDRIRSPRRFDRVDPIQA